MAPPIFPAPKIEILIDMLLYCLIRFLKFIPIILVTLKYAVRQVTIITAKQNIRFRGWILSSFQSNTLDMYADKRYTTIHEGQEEIECSVTQSEGPEDNKEFVNVIHNEMLKLPKGRPAGQPVDITYSYDESGKMHCMFTDVESGNTHEIELTPETTESIDNARKQIEEISIE